MITPRRKSTSYVVLYPKPECDAAPTGQAAPDYRRLASIPWRKTVVLVGALTGSPERVVISHSGACLMPIAPDGRYAPFHDLYKVYEHSDELNAWLRDAAASRGMPEYTPSWLTGEPRAPTHLLTIISKQIATSRSTAIELRDLDGRMATITIPPRQALMPPTVAAPHQSCARIAGHTQYVAAIDRTGELVHLPLDLTGGDIPAPGTVVRIERSMLRREQRMRAKRVILIPRRNTDDT